MDYSSKEDEALAEVDTKTKGVESLAATALERARHIIPHVNQYKQPRLATIQKYRDLYAGRVKPKFRQPFNVVLPTFSGAMDTLMAAFNDDISLEFQEQEPADYLSVRKYNALWQMEVNSVSPNAKFALKTRQDRSNAMFTGRGFMMNYAKSDPEYLNCFETFELEDAIFQPTGGGHWPLHLYGGRQNIVRTAAQLKSGDYNKAQVSTLLKRAAGNDWMPPDTNEPAQTQLTKFKAMGLSPDQNDYVGEAVFKLAEMRITMNGERYYLLFSPWYDVWLRFDKFSAVFSADIDPWVSWATHEDNRNFLTKSFADDMYGVADAVHTLFNQELTNREKRNLNARAYDREMFTDVAKLDQAQYRPDALVPFDSKGGTRKVSDGIYSFETPELRGTIDLIDWTNETTGRSVGVTDLSQGGVQEVSKKATVVFAEQQNISKRFLLRSSSYTEAMGEIGKIYLQGLEDHMPAKRAIRLLGSDGEGWTEVTRADLELYSDVDVRVVSSSQEMRNSQLKKQARMETLDAIAMNPALIPLVNPRWLVEEKLRAGGEFDDHEIKLGMDVKNYGNKEEQAHAHEAIQAVLNNATPQMYYGATTLYMQILIDFASENRTTLGHKYDIIIAHAEAHAPIAHENMMRKAALEQSMTPTDPAAAGAPGAEPAAPALPGGAPSPMAQVRKVAASMP